MSTVPKITSSQYLCNISKKTWRMKVPKIASLQCLYNTSKKKLEMKLIFCMQIKIQSFLQIGFNTLGIKVFYKVILLLLMDMIKHLKVLKVTSLQYLNNISKKKLEMEVIFCMQINIKISKVGLIVFVRTGSTCPKYQK